jgi:hypothetical protein
MLYVTYNLKVYFILETRWLYRVKSENGRWVGYIFLSNKIIYINAFYIDLEKIYIKKLVY